MTKIALITKIEKHLRKSMRIEAFKVSSKNGMEQYISAMKVTENTVKSWRYDQNLLKG
jgi:hypothetical protein